MIVIEETIREDGVKITHTYSDEHFKIRQLDTGFIYDEAYDVVHHEYEETDIKIED